MMDQNISRQLLEFLDASPSCYHAAANVAKELLAAGYTRLYEGEPWHLEEGSRHFTLRGDSSLIAFRIPNRDFRGFMIAAGHSDSPTFKVREAAEVSSAGNCLRLSVEPYGGMVMRSWLDRPLSVAGRVMVRENDKVVSRLVNVDRDLLVIPSVAIHMDREVNKGTPLKANVDMMPLFAEGKEPGAFRRLIVEEAGVEEADLLTTDLFLYTRTKGTLTGAHEEFVASPRLDDLQCVFGCLRGFLAAEDSGSVPVLAVFSQICHEAGVPVQRYSNRADLPGGSTLGNISTAHLSIPSVDIGLPQLAMHSAYEVAGARDTEYLVRAMTAYFCRSFRAGPEGIQI